MFTFYQLVDAWREFTNSASKSKRYDAIRIAGYRKMYLLRNKAQYAN